MFHHESTVSSVTQTNLNDFTWTRTTQMDHLRRLLISTIDVLKAKNLWLSHDMLSVNKKVHNNQRIWWFRFACLPNVRWPKKIPRERAKFQHLQNPSSWKLNAPKKSDEGLLKVSLVRESVRWKKLFDYFDSWARVKLENKYKVSCWVAHQRHHACGMKTRSVEQVSFR